MAGEQLESAGNILANDKPIITINGARRALGTELSSQLTDKDLMRIISDTSHLVNRIFDAKIVPQNEEA